MGEIIEVFDGQEIAISDYGMWNATSIAILFYSCQKSYCFLGNT
ncbi:MULTISPECIES: hypothetical protein [unclassified Okeania]|nr:MULTISPECIES: hypothetical protein [unclassified Okeania]